MHRRFPAPERIDLYGLPPMRDAPPRQANPV
jgi:hypothetical protein